MVVRRRIINKDIVKGHWKEIKGQLKQEWGKLTDDQVSRMKVPMMSYKGYYKKIMDTKKKKLNVRLILF